MLQAEAGTEAETWLIFPRRPLNQITLYKINLIDAIFKAVRV